MQLNPPPSGAATIRGALRAAAVVLLATGLPTPVHAGDAPRWQLDASGLLYGELSRTSVVEPIVRVTRLFSGGQSLSAQLDFDVITGASPTGATPSGLVQTTTTPSGHIKLIPPGQIPLTKFQDVRGALDLEWVRPLSSHVTATTGGHFSREQDYRSTGAQGQLSLDLFQRLSNVTVGAGINRDLVQPLGGTPVGLTAAEFSGTGTNHKRSNSFMVGTSRVMTRRWLLGLNGTLTTEDGYLSEPYKVLSLVDGTTGLPSATLHEERPATRLRHDVLASSVYHHAEDVSYLSYRYYWDDWGVVAHTADLKLRHDFDAERFIQPHVRYYHQGAADFFHYSLRNGAPLPKYASSDYRLGILTTATLGATYGFALPSLPGQVTVRGEYIRQWGAGFPSGAYGVQKTFNLAPPVNIGTVMVGWSLGL